MSTSYTSSICGMESKKGTHRVKIFANSHISTIYSGTSIQCGKFTVAGYQWAIIYVPFQHEDDYVSFYLQLLSETQKSIVVFLCFSLVDQSERVSTTVTKSGTFTYYRKGDKMGFQYFQVRRVLESSTYVKDDSFTIQCNLSVMNLLVEDVTNKYFVPVPPSDLQQHLDHLLQSGEGADVSFKVKGEIFQAHRNILAARSSVFRAELFGSMRESKAGCIEIEDMEPEVFKALLHFIYTDTLHPSDGCTDGGADEDIIAQHLVVAADRYDLGRLRLICEEILAKKISLATVVNTLALAARHNCQKLKEICLNYVSSSEDLHSITESDEFERLIVSCPSIYKELLRKVAAKKNLRQLIKS